MQFTKDTLDRVTVGEIDLAFRRWHKPSVRAGGRLRTAVGVITIGDVRPVEPSDVSEKDVRRAGFDCRDDLLASLRPGEDRTLYRIALSFAGPDPRDALREQTVITVDDLDGIADVLQRIDARIGRGPWSARVLALIGERPGTPARELAEVLGREPLRFKADVRRLKEHGLTESLNTGYRLSPRGLRVLDHLRDHG